MTIRTREQLRRLQRANRETLRMLHDLQVIAKPGVTGRMLDEYARAFIAEIGGEPAFETQNGFPGAINFNPNDVVIHGIPGDYVLHDGDLLTLDGGMILDGMAGDAAITFTIGEPAPRHQRLMDAGMLAMNAAIAAAKVGNRLGDVGWAMQHAAESSGYRVVRDFCGHGIGSRLWEEPLVPPYGTAGTGMRLKEGMVFTVEPAVIEGHPGYYMANRWEARSNDGSLVVQNERAIVVTRHGGIVLGEHTSPDLPGMRLR